MFWRLVVWLLRNAYTCRGTLDDRFDRYGICRKRTNGEIVPVRLLEKKCSFFL